MANKIDSNATGLRYCEETSLKTLPGSPVFYPLEPNSYSGFGGKLALVSRNPINQTRQQSKGVITDLDASGGFEQDFTATNSFRLLQGFMFADAREKVGTAKLNSASVPVTACTATTYVVANGASFRVGDIVFGQGFAVAANNGIHVLTIVAAGTLTTTGCAIETPAATASLTVVGHEFASGDITIVKSGNMPRLTSAAFNFVTSSDLIPGEWIYVGGDVTGNKLTGDLTGFGRIGKITATYLELDKVNWAAATDPGTGKSVRMFWGSVLKNESDPTIIKRRSYQLERQLGSDANGVMSEYLVGAVANELTFNVKTADKITMAMSFVAMDNEQRDGTTGVKAGATRPANVASDPFNTSSDFSRIKLAKVDAADPKPTPLFVYATDLTLKVANNVSGIKALGTLGSFDTAVGNFVVSGNLTCYFADIAGVQAVRNNADVTIDIAIAKKNTGYVFDIPLMSLGNGQVTIEQDKAITLPFDLSASASPVFNHTLLINYFPYLPTIAE